MRPRWQRIVLAAVWLAAALAAVTAPAIAARAEQAGSCGDLPAAWCQVAP